MKKRTKIIGLTLALFVLSIYFIKVPVFGYLNGAQIHDRDRDRLQWVIYWTPYILIVLGVGVIAIILFKKIQSKKN
jgi:hypothetical protein